MSPQYIARAVGIFILFIIFNMTNANAAPRLATPISIPEFIAIPKPVPDFEITYGAAEVQAIDVFLPTGRGPFPVALMIHGGCWSATTAAREQLRHLGTDLAKRGIAVWNIGYRRADEIGGGYPGTYQDVGIAIDRLRDYAERYRLDLSRTVLVGHSAGGHLALWAAARTQLPVTSALHVTRPFVPSKVIALAGIGDLKNFAPQIPRICGPGVAENLVGKPTPDRLDVFADISPAALIAKGATITMVSGVLDRLVPPYVAHDYARAVQRDIDVKLMNVADAGHFDLVTTGRPAWAVARRMIEAALTSP
jgi:acetyl esterase/lipase